MEEFERKRVIVDPEIQQMAARAIEEAAAALPEAHRQSLVNIADQFTPSGDGVRSELGGIYRTALRPYIGRHPRQIGRNEA